MVMRRTRAVECGQKLRLSVPGEYPCVRRFRYRRLLTFLWLQGYCSAFVTMLNHTDSYFCVLYLVRLVSQGQWTKALDYIFPRFLPLQPCSPPSLEATVLVKFLLGHKLYQSEVCSKFPRDWRPMWATAAAIVQELANRTPEFKDRLLLPDGPMGPHNVLPIAFGFAPFRRRRHVVKDHTRPSPTSKHARQKHTRRMAYIYVKKRMSVPSSSHCSQELSPEIIDKAREDWFRRMFEECIKASNACPELNQGRDLQSSAREGASVAGNSQPQIGGCPQTQSPVPNRRPSRMLTRKRAVVCGQELGLFVPGEYPCVRRFRYRRLLTFLRLQGFGSTFVAMSKQTSYYLCVLHLARLVSRGLWAEALDYTFPRFLPLEPCSPPSLEATVLVKFLRMHRLFQVEVASKISRDWRPMWAIAAKIVRDLANRTPEFKDRLLLLDRPMGPQSILPIGFGYTHRLAECIAIKCFAPFRRRRHIKKCTRSTSKHAHEEHTHRIANFYFNKRKSHCSQELSPENVAKARDDWFVRIFEECIKAYTCPEINQWCALCAWEGTPVSGNVINTGSSSVPLTTDTGSATSQTMLGTMACPAKDSEVISTTNAGTGQEIRSTKGADACSRAARSSASTVASPEVAAAGLGIGEAATSTLPPLVASIDAVRRPSAGTVEVASSTPTSPARSTSTAEVVGSAATLPLPTQTVVSPTGPRADSGTVLPHTPPPTVSTFADGITPPRRSGRFRVAADGASATDEDSLKKAMRRKAAHNLDSHGTDKEVCFTESARQGSHPRKRPMTEQTDDCSATKKGN